MFLGLVTSGRFSSVRAVTRQPRLTVRSNLTVGSQVFASGTSCFGSGSNFCALIVGGGDTGSSIATLTTSGFTGFGKGSGGGSSPDLRTFHGNLHGLRISNAGLYLNSDAPLYFTSGTSYGTSADCSISRDSANTIQLGGDSASPSDQAFKAADGVGTDKVGAAFTLEGGQSTGTARGGAVQIRTSISGASSGASANSYSVRQYHSAMPVDLGEGVATQFCSIALAAGTVIGLQLSCTVWASDGADFQTLQSVISVCAVNKAGTMTISAVSQSDTGACNSAGTLTPVTYSAAASGNNLVLKCNATSSLTQTVLRVKWSILSINSTDAATVTPS